MALKNPHITNSVARGKASSKLVWNIFADRPWVLTVAETKQNSIEDAQGFDMFVKVVNLFGSVLKLDGKDNVLSVQIKSSERSVREFFHKYSNHKRFFNQEDRYHQFILCGMEEPEVVMADIVGQIVAHANNFKLSETDVINFLIEVEDFEIVDAYKKYRILMLSRWYGVHLPPL